MAEPATRFDRYATSYRHIRMKRANGILEVQLHSNGGSLQWGAEPHSELAHAFRAISQDPDNLIMILTGTGDSFSGPRADQDPNVSLHAMPAREWEKFHNDGMELMDSLLSVRAIVIGAVNGPALRHCELVLLSDIVIASSDAQFQDSAHFSNGLTPGDGINVITPLVMGLTRARYFHLTGQVLTAHDGQSLGLVNEVVPPAAVMPRARELAAQLARQRPMVLRHTRLLFTHELRQRMLSLVAYGLALEGLDIADAHDNSGQHS